MAIRLFEAIDRFFEKNLVNVVLSALLVAVLWCLVIVASGCSSYTQDQLKSFQETMPALLKAAGDLGVEADAELKFGKGSIGQRFVIDLGLDGAIWLRARPGEINAKDLLEINNRLLDIIERMASNPPPE